MKGGLPLALAAALAGLPASGCGPRRVSAPQEPQSPAMVVLLADPESGKTGRARIANDHGRVELAAERQSTVVSANGSPSAVTVMSDDEVTRIFGGAIAALPPAPKHFTLYFQFESDQLTAESVALVPEILQAVKSLEVPEVAVVGHTDTMGTERANFDLGLKRGNTVRALLVDAGLAESTIEVTSHGEGDLLVRTGNNKAEPRNRRVEIAVR
jgi:outer membrane protein OmpA-like peptidoglycan-associated protein